MLQQLSSKQWPKVLVILSLAIIVAIALNSFKPVAEKKVVKEALPPVEIMQAKLESVSIPVFSQGSIKAKTRIKLLAEVSGRVKQMAKLKNNGGFFNKDDWLLSIDDTDYRLGMTRAQAKVVAAKQQLIRAKTEADQAKYDLQQIGRDPSKSSSYALREPQLAEAQANLQAAQADVEISRLQMQRTRVLAPFTGRVVSKQVDIGQYVSSGTQLAEIYSTDAVTIRLPLSIRQAQLLGLRLRDNEHLVDNIKIKLSAHSLSSDFQWNAKLSHIEGEIDQQNRLVYLVAQVDFPYQKNKDLPDRPPLTPGMFVKAELYGIEKQSVKIPRGALRFNHQVWLLESESTLKKVSVDVLSKSRDFVFIKSGVSHGDKVIINAIDFPVDGMRLSLVAPLSAHDEKIK